MLCTEVYFMKDNCCYMGKCIVLELPPFILKKRNPSVSHYIFQAGRRIVDLFEGFKDGHNLLSLLEVLSHETLVSYYLEF